MLDLPLTPHSRAEMRVGRLDGTVKYVTPSVFSAFIISF